MVSIMIHLDWVGLERYGQFILLHEMIYLMLQVSLIVCTLLFVLDLETWDHEYLISFYFFEGELMLIAYLWMRYLFRF